MANLIVPIGHCDFFECQPDVHVGAGHEVLGLAKCAKQAWRVGQLGHLGHQHIQLHDLRAGDRAGVGHRDRGCQTEFAIGDGGCGQLKVEECKHGVRETVSVWTTSTGCIVLGLADNSPKCKLRGDTVVLEVFVTLQRTIGYAHVDAHVEDTYDEQVFSITQGTVLRIFFPKRTSAIASPVAFPKLWGEKPIDVYGDWRWWAMSTRVLSGGLLELGKRNQEVNNI
ncbi:hypothetical protein L210DRAFT_3502075 [Boletus edulis BED1]|uniref:Uncharacterized protein n=1 Tax=Boletus edulis BED1 TaxID=1328754 RepID=A0AAD4GHD0_BOLED|nr:hypothetical protein L210DRAFT_3502075 [Boletus edulis BED1]